MAAVATAPAGPRLWLVRHAQPLVAPGTCYGALDVPADAQATHDAARRLAEALPARASVWHSTLQRCEHLALALQALRPDLVSKPDARLREMDFGSWEGRAWDAVDRSAIDAWTAAFPHYPPGGGEPLQAMLARVAAALQHAARLPAGAAPGAPEGERDVVWITHAGVIRCVTWLLAQGPGVLPRSQDWPVAAPAWGAWQQVQLPAAGRLSA